jgi:hypothetical protein
VRREEPGGQEQHVALAQEVLGAHHMEIGLDEAGDHVDAAALGGQHQVHAD